MRIIFSFLLFSLLVLQLSAQERRDYIWFSGDVVEDTTSYNGVNVMNFNGGELDIKRQANGLGFFVTNASICRPSGELLFYTNGCSINSANHELIENGAGLNPGNAYLSGNCPDYGNTAANGAVILPLPEYPTKYYLFHTSFVSGEPGIFSFYIGKIFCSIIDMSLNDGFGAVMDKNLLVLDDTLSTDLQAVKHENDKDWWIITIKYYENKYYKILFTENGVLGITEQKIGIDPDPWFSGGGQASFSPDGTKYARYTKGDQVFLFDFDRSTGELSNFQHLYADTTEGFWGSLSFSSNSRYLYVSTQLKLWQFDMEASDIQASKTLIDEYDGFTSYGLPTTFYLSASQKYGL